MAAEVAAGVDPWNVGVGRSGQGTAGLLGQYAVQEMVERPLLRWAIAVGGALVLKGYCHVVLPRMQRDLHLREGRRSISLAAQKAREVFLRLCSSKKPCFQTGLFLFVRLCFGISAGALFSYLT